MRAVIFNNLEVFTLILKLSEELCRALQQYILSPMSRATGPVPPCVPVSVVRLLNLHNLVQSVSHSLLFIRPELPASPPPAYAISP